MLSIIESFTFYRTKGIKLSGPGALNVFNLSHFSTYS